MADATDLPTNPLPSYELMRNALIGYLDRQSPVLYEDVHEVLDGVLAVFNQYLKGEFGPPLPINRPTND